MSDGTEARQRGQAASGGRSVLDALASLKFALSVVVLLALACVVGTLLPQGAEAARYLHGHPEAARRMALFSALGLTNVFYSWWFAALLAILATSLSVCSLRRYAMARAVRGTAKVRATGALITHVSMLLILAGGVVRGLWGQKGVIEFREGETVDGFATGERVAPLPFAVHLKKFEIDYYDAPKKDKPDAGRLLVAWPGGETAQEFPVELNVAREATPPAGATNTQPARLTVKQYLPDFFIDSETREARSRSTAPRNPAIQVCVEGAGRTNLLWLFARFPEFSGSHDTNDLALQMRFVSPAADANASRPVKEYRSTLVFVENGAATLERAIEVNRPFSHKGFTFYQSGYNPEDPAWTSLQVVRDPGVPVVYAGFVLIMVGLTMVFCVSPYLNSHRQQPGADR